MFYPVPIKYLLYPSHNFKSIYVCIIYYYEKKILFYLYFQILQSKFEPAEVKYEGKMDKDSITKWVKENYHGLCGHRTVDNARDFKEPLVMAFFDVDYVKNVKGTNYWRNRIMKVAQNFKSLNFAHRSLTLSFSAFDVTV